MFGLDDAPSVRQKKIDVLKADPGGVTGAHDPRWPGIAERVRMVDRYIERVQTIDHRFETGKVGIIVDEEGQRVGDVPERASGLRHHTELDFTGEIEWRCEDIGNDRVDLAKGLRKRRDPHTSMDEREIIGDERPKALPHHVLLCGFAVQKRNLLGEFAQAGEREAEVGFHVLTLKIQIDERASDQVGNQCPQARIQQGDPEQKAWQDDVGAGKRERFRQAPQHDGKGHERESVEIRRIEKS